MATATSATDSVSERLARLATWRPGGARAVPVEDRLPVFLLVSGAIVMPLGIVVVILGWYGAAHTPFGFEQTPYLISGGLLGVCLVLVGGFLFFGSWVARVAVTTQKTVDQLNVLTARLERLGDGSAIADGSSTGIARGTGTSSRLVATATGTMLHRSDCPIVSNRDNIRDVKPGEQDSLKPCQICNPLD